MSNLSLLLPHRLLVDELFCVCRAELRRIALGLMRRERRDHTLRPTELVHEAYHQLARARRLTIQDESHFRNLMIRKMKRCLIDHAKGHRKRTEARRLSRERHAGTETTWLDPRYGVWFVELLDRLRDSGQVGSRRARMVELVFYLGAEKQEAAREVGISDRQFRREWLATLAWLEAQLRAIRL